MEVIVAKSAGFCFGVKRAVDSLEKLVETKTDQKIYTYGPIIHNESVIQHFESRGVTVLHSKEELLEIQDGIVVIRSHGVGKEIYELLNYRGIEYCDMTCPFVRKIHDLVAEYERKGCYILIAGDKNHPEVQGILGWCSPDNSQTFQTASEFEKLGIEKDRSTVLVAQTTFNHNKFKNLVEIINKKGYDINVLDTICNATEVRQSEAIQLSKDVDAMLVIGSKNSSNTQKLFEISRVGCPCTYLVQTSTDLDGSIFKGIKSVGITAGASTPKKIIEEVQTNVRNRKF
ncbi:4-hydroxy-3-methylbut-2-enyl diphosphate reductase [Eubacterium oxidoreducens]|uniref:4-hydroxy-3-methylbut-2-enyl diphosphate reductase n=1 Tax=Eubacterium oxidoreducens TaxID=1732 RepID=A0A1G6AN71_EUBOX|nr:4-hydroxy-3-methylbut-2-enyl diphosphate reductase [Eubacterium oxidoreducens]SDB09832.1 4-hydroxy-3-methylbut-2-enyl diphosphate reductase [Eubacterium oxidoreducens]